MSRSNHDFADLCDAHGLCFSSSRSKQRTQAIGMTMLGGGRVLAIRALAACVIASAVLIGLGG